VLGACRFWNLSQHGVGELLCLHDELQAATTAKPLVACLLRIERVAIESQSLSEKWAAKFSDQWRGHAGACRTSSEVATALSWLYSQFVAPVSLSRADFLDVSKSVSVTATVPDVGDEVAIIASGLKSVWTAALSAADWPMPDVPTVQKTQIVAAQYASEAVRGPWGAYCAAWFIVRPLAATDASGAAVGKGDLPALAVPILVFTPPAKEAAEYLVPWAAYLKSSTRVFRFDEPIKMLFSVGSEASYYMGHVTDTKRGDPWESVEVRWLNEETQGDDRDLMWVSPWELEPAPEVGPPLNHRAGKTDAAARSAARRAANQNK
jgi:hypothetical protein